MLQKLDFKFSDDKFVKEGSVTLLEEDGFTLMLTVPEHEFWKSVYKDEDKEPSCVFFVKELEPGIYLSTLNFEHHIRAYTDFESVRAYDRLGKDGLPKKYEQNNSMMNFFEETVSTYGVADNIEQIKELFKEQIASSAPIAISVTEINKESQPEQGGWRWHKWGEYIGVQQPQCEYIYDEPEIERVYVYHVYALEPKEKLEIA